MPHFNSKILSYRDWRSTGHLSCNMELSKDSVFICKRVAGDGERADAVGAGGGDPLQTGARAP